MDMSNMKKNRLKIVLTSVVIAGLAMVYFNSKPKSHFEKLGFKNGDLIKGLNGKAVNSAAEAMDLYNELKSKKVKVHINSKTKNKSVTYEVK